ncbi:MAG: hypothetical protein ACHQE5_10525 [Actinomycetes bacterium]
MMRAFRWSAGTVGVALILVAGWGIVRDRGYTDPLGLGAWLAAGVLLHDLVLAPLLILVGVLVSRSVPSRVRAVVVVGLVSAGTLILVGVPVALAAARPRANPTILPLDYWRGLVLSVLVVAVVTAVAAVIAARRPAGAQVPPM